MLGLLLPLSLSRLVYACNQTQVVEQTDNFVLGTQRIASKATDRSVSIHFACRRVVCKHRTMIVWESLAVSKASVSRSVPAARVTTLGDGVIRRAADADLTLMQSVVRISTTLLIAAIERDNDEEEEEEETSDTSSASDAGLFAEPVIATYRHHTQTGWRAIENALLDDHLRTSGRADAVQPRQL